MKKINTALILCAGYGKRLNPLTLNKPKPLLKVKDISLLENTINLINDFGIKNILINTFYLKEQIKEFINKKNFNCKINIIEDGNSILDTGGGILNLIKKSDDENFLVFNPDTIWNFRYLEELKLMEKLFFQNKKKCVLLLVNKKKSFDQSFKGDFNLSGNLVERKASNNLDYIYTGLQIAEPGIFTEINEKVFSMNKMWDKLIKDNSLYAIESSIDFLHVSNLEI